MTASAALADSTATGAAAANTAGGSSALSGIFNAVSSILHHPLGFYAAALGAISLFNKPGGDPMKGVINLALAGVATWAVSAMFPGFLTSMGMGGGAAATAGNGVAGKFNFFSNNDAFSHILGPIAQHESGWNPFILNGGGTFPASASIEQVRGMGKAAGLFQIMPGNGIAESMGIPASANFAANQFSLAKGLVMKRGALDFLTGRMSAPDFVRSLAGEWCVVPKDASQLSRYAGIGNNPDTASIPYGEMLQHVLDFKKAFTVPGLAPGF